eukprot:COSAG02_NODE_1045_length_15004_cov_13.824220_3_plen_1075_part_00
MNRIGTMRQLVRRDQEMTGYTGSCVNTCIHRVTVRHTVRAHAHWAPDMDMDAGESAEEGVPPSADAPVATSTEESGCMASIPGIEALISLRREHSSQVASEPPGAGVDGPASEANREGQLSATHREALVQEYGEESVGGIEAAAQELFARLDTERDGRLSLHEFAQALGQLGASAAGRRSGLATYMFHAVDADDSGAISFDEFCQWMLTMLCGTPQTKLRLGFNLCDLDKSGSINRSEVAVLLDSIFSVLSGLSLGECNPEVENMLNAIFKHSTDGDSLTWQQYCKACIEDKNLISHLGHERLLSSIADTDSVQASAGAEETQQKQMGSLTFFGQKRWELMLSLMVGLQIAVEHTSTTDASDADTITQTWSRRQQYDSDDLESTEPVPERVYRIPSARDGQEIANDERAIALLTAAIGESSSSSDEVPNVALDAFVSASAEIDLQPAIGRALAKSAQGRISALFATRTDTGRGSPDIDRDAEASAVTSVLQAATAILEAARLQDLSSQSDAFSLVEEDSDGLAGEKEGPEYSTELEVQAAITDGLHIGYFLANGKYTRLHPSRGLLRKSRRWKPGAPNSSVEKVWKYTGELMGFQHNVAIAFEEAGFAGVVTTIRDTLRGRAEALQQHTVKPEPWEKTVLSLADSILTVLGETAPPPQVASWGKAARHSSGPLESSAASKNAMITVIGGQLFRDIRAAFGILDHDFLGALGIRQVIGGLLMGDLRGLSELVSEGKSGSLFFWSHNGRFMVKTISSDERDSLRDMLRPYKSFVASHPNTLLTKYLGLYDLAVPNANTDGSTATYHLVVMANVFNTNLQIEERFDLKGSTHQRTVGPSMRGTPGLVHKDLDFKEMRRHIAVSSDALAEQLRNQIRQDVSFLASQGVIDYSLLLGIAKTDQTTAPQQSAHGDGHGGGGGGNDALSSSEFSAWLSEHKHVLRASYDAIASAGACNSAALSFEAFAHFVFQNRDEERAAKRLLAVEDGTDDSECLSVPEPTSLFTRNQGGMLGSSHQGAQTDEVLFVGVIDTLVPFKLKKKAEFVAKSVLQHGQNFSVIPPEEYASRFIAANTSIVCSR